MMSKFLQGQPDIRLIYKPQDEIAKSIQSEILSRQSTMMGKVDDHSMGVSPELIDRLDSGEVINTGQFQVFGDELAKALSVDLEKAGKGNLVQKTITDKNGRRRKVWVIPTAAASPKKKSSSGSFDENKRG